jgi:hypothetical protein
MQDADPLQERAVHPGKPNPRATVAVERQSRDTDVADGVGGILVASGKVDTVAPHAVHEGILEEHGLGAVEREAMLRTRNSRHRSRTPSLVGLGVGSEHREVANRDGSAADDPPVRVRFRILRHERITRTFGKPEPRKRLRRPGTTSNPSMYADP